MIVLIVVWFVIDVNVICRLWKCNSKIATSAIEICIIETLLDSVQLFVVHKNQNHEMQR